MTDPVAEEAGPDTFALTHVELSAIAARMEGAGAELAGPLSSRLIVGGRSNLTYRLDDGSSAWVLRMPPRVARTPSAHDVAREFRFTSALATSGVPVAPAVVLCEDKSVIGLPFTVFGFVTGHTVQSREDLGALDDDTVAACTSRLVETLAALHRVDHRAVGLSGFGRAEGYAARQIRRWSSQWEIVGDPTLTTLVDELSGRLRAAPVEQKSVGIVHGDFRIDNTIFDLVSDPRILAVVDWELSTIGDPVADVAMFCVYRHPALDLVLGSPSAWTSDRLPSPEDLAAAYEAAGGVELVDWDFHLALGYFKLAVIAAGIEHRYRAGATTGRGFDTAGDAVPHLLQSGLDAWGALA